LTFTNQGDPTVLEAVGVEVSTASPDFIVHLGDMLDFHKYGFNDPPPDGSITRAAYLNYRSLLGDSIARAAHFPTIGNWEGENGTYTADEIARSMQQRWLYVPAPEPTTYPESGSPNQDYYAFTWGDALFIVLNVMTYTPTEHLLGSNPGLPDDWTLGPAQLAWLGSTLAAATAKWRFLLIHHTVGGKAGDDSNSAYGRGGGQAAYVGEQAQVHQWMLQYGAQIFFYGHDHVFADMTVDGIHYTLPGNAGAIWKFSSAETGYAQSWLEHGWTRVDVSPAQVHVQFIKKGGGILYDYTLP
jgi:3',5'-cyclic AMP phosphodiesterase CpdA